MLLYAAGGFVLVLVGLYLLRGPLFARPLGRWVASELSRTLGGTFTAQEVRGAWFADAVLVELRTERPPERGPLAGLSWRRLEVTYGIIDLIRKRPLSGLHSLRIDGLVVDLDFTRPGGGGGGGGHGAGADPLADLPARLPALELHGSLRARLPLAHGSAGTLTLGSFALVSDGPAADLDCAAITLPELGIAQERWKARVERDGASTFRLEATDELAGLVVRRLAIGEERALDLTIGVAGGEIMARARPGGIGAHLAGVDCARLPPWLGRLVEVPTRGVLDGHVSAQRADGGWQAAAALRARDAAWRGFDARLIAVDGSWDGTRLDVRSIDVDSDLVQTTVRGIEVEPRGAWLRRAPEACTIVVPDCSTLLTRLALPVPAALRGRGPIELRFTATGHGARLDPLRLDLTGSGVAAEVVGAADLPGDDDWRSIVLTAGWSLDLHAEDFPGLGPGWAGEIEGRGHVDGRVASPRAGFRVSGHGLRIRGHELGAIEMAGSGAWPRLELERAELTHPAGRVSFSGAIDAEARSARDARLTADVADLGALAASIPGAPKLAGSIRGELSIDQVALGEPVLTALRSAHGALTVVGKELTIGERRLGALDIEARLADRRLDLAHAELDGPVRLGLAGSATFADAGSIDASISRLEAAMPGQPMASARSRRAFTVAYAPSAPRAHWRVSPASFDACGGRVEVAVDLAERIDATVIAVGISPWALLPPRVPTISGKVDWSLAARGDPRSSPEGSFHLRTAGLIVGGHESSIAVDTAQGQAGLRLSRLELRIADALDASIAGFLPACVGLDGVRPVAGVPQLQARAFAAIAPGLVPETPGMPETGCADLRAAVDESGARLDLAVRELVVRIPPADPDLRAPPESIAEADIHAEAAADGWRARIAARDSGGLALAGEGSGRAGFDAQRPWAFLAALRQDDLAGRLTLERLELARGAALLPQLVRLSGTASGELRVSGRPFMPRWDGELVLEAVGVKARSDLPAIVDGRGRLRLEGTRVTIEELSARLGYQPVVVTGSADLGNFEPAFDLAAHGSNVLLARNQYLRLRADCDLKLHGPLEAMELSGTMRVTDGLYSRPIELLSRLRPSGGHKVKQEGVKLFSIREGPLAAMTFDVGITGTESFHVRTNVFRGDCSLDLHLGGTGESPLPRGRAWTEDARLRMPFTTIRVAQATVLFPPDNPYVPRLDGEGEARLKGYDLRVHANGELPDIEVTVDSDPPLSTSEGVMLLTTGLTGRERDEPGAERTELTMVGKYFAKEVWHEFKGPGDPDQESGLLDLDRLDISIGQQLSESGQETIDAEYELSSRFYLHGERDLFDDYNIGLIWRLRRH